MIKKKKIFLYWLKFQDVDSVSELEINFFIFHVSFHIFLMQVLYILVKLLNKNLHFHACETQFQNSIKNNICSAFKKPILYSSMSTRLVSLLGEFSSGYYGWVRHSSEYSRWDVLCQLKWSLCKVTCNYRKTLVSSHKNDLTILKYHFKVSEVDCWKFHVLNLLAWV